MSQNDHRTSLLQNAFEPLFPWLNQSLHQQTKKQQIITFILSNMENTFQEQHQILFHPCVTSSNRAQELINVKPLPIIQIIKKREIQQSSRFQHFQKGTFLRKLAYFLQKHKQNLLQNKIKEKSTRLKYFSFTELQQFIEIQTQAKLFTDNTKAYKEVYGLQKIEKLFRDFKILVPPISHSRLGHELIKDGSILIAIIQILTAVSSQGMQDRLIILSIFGQLEIQTHCKQFWDYAKRIFSNFNSQYKDKLIQSNSCSQQSSNRFYQKNYDYGGDLRGLNKQAKLNLFQPKPNVEAIFAEKAKESSPKIFFSSSKSKSKLSQAQIRRAKLKRAPRRLTYQDISKDDDVIFEPHQNVKENSIKKMHFEQQPVSSVRYFNSETNQYHNQSFSSDKNKSISEIANPSLNQQRSPEQVRMDIQMIPQELICADLNGHGNYALVKLTHNSALQLGSQFAMVPICRLGQQLKRQQVLKDKMLAIKLTKTLNIGFTVLNVDFNKFIQNEQNRQRTGQLEQTIHPSN